MQISDVISENLISDMVLGMKLTLFYIAVVWVALAFWAYRDIQRRTNDSKLITFAVLLTICALRSWLLDIYHVAARSHACRARGRPSPQNMQRDTVGIHAAHQNAGNPVRGAKFWL